MWEQKQNLLPISATIVVFFINMDTKVAWQKFLASGPSSGKKNMTFSKKSRFFWPAWIFSITSRKRAIPEISVRPQNFRPQIFFCLPVKKLCYGFGRLRWTLTLRNLKILNFFEKFDFSKISKIFGFDIFWKIFGFCILQKFIIWYEKFHDMIL